MDIRLYAFLLLIGHLVSAVFILLVLIRQAGLFKKRIQPGLVKIRRVLFLLALIIFAGNFLPILIDVLTITGAVQRSTNHVNKVGLLYGGSVAIIFVLLSLLVWVLYKMAEMAVIIFEHEKAEISDIQTKQ